MTVNLQLSRHASRFPAVLDGENLFCMAQSRNPKRKVFLVDDHPLVREWLANLINQQPDLITVGEAAGVAQALAGVATAKPDAVIVDLSLGESSGLDLIKKLQQAHPQLVVLVLSMHEDTLYAGRALRAGARGYVMKRASSKKVIEALRQVLQGEFYFEKRAEQDRPELPAADQASVQVLSDRELAVFEMLGQGLGTRQIAESLQISIKTVQAHCANIKQKLKLSNATRLRREAMRQHDDNRSS
jgi:DNA-binding NarL/FixJ family response regulator